MTFGNKESCLAYIESMRAKCRKRYEELSIKYSIDKLDCSQMSEEEIHRKKLELENLKRLIITTEFGCFYL